MRFAAGLESIFSDLRFGLRQFAKTPLIMLAVILSLAIGIGANTAVFTLLDAVVLRPLPVPDPDKLVVIRWANADGFPAYVGGISGDADNGPDGGMISTSVSAPLHRALARESNGFETIVGAGDAGEVAVSVGAAPARPVGLQYVSSNFFRGLGVTPQVGRSFVAEEDSPGASPVVVVSDRFYRAWLGGEPDDLGRTLRINDVDVRIVGVAPRGFFGLTVGQWTDVYAPLSARSVLDRSTGESTEDPASWWVRQVAVLSDDVPESTALAELNNLFRNHVAELAGSEGGTASVPELFTSPGQRGVGEPNDQIRTALWLLMLLVGALLLIVCANVANLLLARSESRLRDSVLRLTLGATPARIFRQQLIECLMLALAGAVAGVALGYALSSVIQELFQVGRGASDLFALRLDARVLGYTTVLSLAAALVFGTSPALRAARAYRRGSLNVHSRSISSATLRGPKVLVSAQLALCLAALVAAGLLGQSLKRLTEIDLGFDPDNLVYATVNPKLGDFPADRIEGYLDDVQHALEALPGVVSVSRMTRRPLEGGGNFSPVNIPGNPRAQEFDPRFVTNVNGVGPEAFETLRISLLSGSTVDRPANGVVVDERFAERFFDGDALGRRFGMGAPENDDQYEIVGIARNTISLQLRREPVPTIYVPHEVTPFAPATHFAIRTARNSDLLLDSIRTVVSSVSPLVPLTEIRTQTELLDRMLRSERLLAFLSAGFGLIATALGAIGLAGLLAYAVARRTNEIGLRMALGAAPGRMVTMVMKDSLKLIVAGLAVGLPCAYGIAKLLESSLYELTPSDPATMMASIGILLAISFAAALLPARRAAKTAPSMALRED